MKIEEKQQRLDTILAEYGSIAIAFSGGVDSSFLAAAAKKMLPGKVLLLNAQSPAFPEDEAAFVRWFADEQDLPLRIVNTKELDIKEYAENAPTRCYFCRHELFAKLRPIAEAADIAVLADGANADDRNDFRPGLRAAAEWEVKHPLQDAGLEKADIRELSRLMNLPTWNKPAYACLASRFPYGEKINPKKLQRVAAAERVLQRRGFRIYRVRSHGNLARLEFGDDEIERGFLMREELSCELKELGYAYITIDLQGYRMGSMNEVLFKNTGRDADSHTA